MSAALGDHRDCLRQDETGDLRHHRDTSDARRLPGLYLPGDLADRVDGGDVVVALGTSRPEPAAHVRRPGSFGYGVTRIGRRAMTLPPCPVT